MPTRKDELIDIIIDREKSKLNRLGFRDRAKYLKSAMKDDLYGSVGMVADIYLREKRELLMQKNEIVLDRIINNLNA